MLVTGELFPSSRAIADAVDVPGETEMANVEHLGQYVYQMTNSKVQQFRAERGLPAADLTAPVGMDNVQEESLANEELYEDDIEEGFEAEEVR